MATFTGTTVRLDNDKQRDKLFTNVRKKGWRSTSEMMRAMGNNSDFIPVNPHAEVE